MASPTLFSSRRNAGWRNVSINAQTTTIGCLFGDGTSLDDLLTLDAHRHLDIAERH
jgi:hypothetical protein